MHDNGKSGKNNPVITMFFPAVIVVLLEVFLFNFPYWESLAYSQGENEIPISVGPGLKSVDGALHVVNKKQAYVQVLVPQKQKIQNIRVMATGDDHRYGQPRATLYIAPTVLDDGNPTKYVQLGTAHVTGKLLITQFIRIHAAGNVHKLRLKFTNVLNGDNLKVESVQINTIRPFDFSIIRLAIMLLVAYGILLLRPSSSIYHWKLALSQNRQRLLLGMVICIQIILVLGITELTFPGRAFAKPYMSPDGSFINDDNQYDHLADAIIAGHPWLDLHVPDWLSSMHNPYDTAARSQFALKTGDASYWDYAFYGGKYYSYFGAIPALLTFVPWKLLSGQDLRNDVAVIIFAMAFILATVFFMHKLFSRYFANASFGIFLLSCLLFINCSNLLNLIYLPKIYSVPILASLMFTMLAFGFWVMAKESGSLLKIPLVIGSLCMAANLGCRPQFVFAAVLALPLFWNEIRDGLFLSVRGLPNLLCMLLPFIVIGGVAMTYNKMRFGSLFNFGVTYNLTGFDVSHHSTAFMRIPWGVWMYLFQPINFSPNFPFMQVAKHVNGFMGETITEPFFGGFFAFAPVTLSVFGVGMSRERLRKNGLFSFSICALVLSLLLICLDTVVGGISPRYMSDFGWLLLMVAIIVITSYFAGLQDSENKRHKLLTAVVALVLLGIVLNYLNLFANGRYSDLSTANPLVYRFFESWLIFLQ